MPSHVIPLAPVSVPTAAAGADDRPPLPSWTAAAQSPSYTASSSTPAGRLGAGSLLASLAQSSLLTWFTCGITALVGPRSRRGITQQAATSPEAVVDAQPGHTVVSPLPAVEFPNVPAPPPAITIDSSSPPRNSYPRHLSSSPVSYEIPIPGTQPTPPAPTTSKLPTSSRWISLSRLFQSLSAIRLSSSSSRSTPTSHLTIPTHFRGRRSRSQSLHRSPTSSSFSHSSFSHSSFSSTTTSTPPPNTPPVKPHAMLLPDSPLDREYAQWCAARDARAWIVAGLAEIGVDPHAPAGVSGVMETEFGRVPPVSPMSTQSFQSAATTTIAEGLVQCVLQGGVEVDAASAMAAPVDALRAVVARFAGLVVENVSMDEVAPVGFVAVDREVQGGELPELVVVAVREVYHALKALRSPPPMYSEMAAGEAFL